MTNRLSSGVVDNEGATVSKPNGLPTKADDHTRRASAHGHHHGLSLGSKRLPPFDGGAFPKASET